MQIKYMPVILSALLVSLPATAEEPTRMGMMYGNPQTMRGPQSGMYPAPPMNPQMMQQMMESRQKQMQEMRSQQQAASQQAAEQAAAARPAMPDAMPEACKSRHKMVDSMMQRRTDMDNHMQNIERRLASIESLLQELITLIKSK
ncbi:MAG: hypothetical protein PVG66_05455 [Chromatiales bacterium]|jgi:hypothetical protein